ncbi:MAG: archaemetzincin family Zn-dependent metalloprotease [bacterium]
MLNASSISEAQLKPLESRIADVFSVQTTLLQETLNLERVFDASRGQYNSTGILAQQLGKYSNQKDKLVTLVDVDLFIPVLTFVFGEAQLNGPMAVVSMYRLMNEFYGIPPSRPVLIQRIEKEIIHELGHTFGLYHCRQFECVMRSSTYVEEIDLKRSDLCPDCHRQLSDLLRNLSQSL